MPYTDIISGLLLCPNQLNHTVLHMVYPGTYISRNYGIVLKILSKMQISIVLLEVGHDVRMEIFKNV